MTTFTAWKFDTPDGADHATGVLKDAARDGLVSVLDHAVVSWPVGADKPRTSHGHENTWHGAGVGAFWGLLFGVLFMMPVAAVAAGAGLGAFTKAREGLGITDEQLERLRAEIGEGTSALFAVTDQGDLDRLGERFRGMHSKLLATNLTSAEREVLLETFGGDGR